MNEKDIDEAFAQARDEFLSLLWTSITDVCIEKDIYDHGYPEARLIPANHIESCEEMYKDNKSCEAQQIMSRFLDALYEHNYRASRDD